MGHLSRWQHRIAVELEKGELTRMRAVSARCRAPSVELATAAIRVVLEMLEGTVRAIVAQYGRRSRQNKGFAPEPPRSAQG